jgi:hypothetical protein
VERYLGSGHRDRPRFDASADGPALEHWPVRRPRSHHPDWASGRLRRTGCSGRHQFAGLDQAPRNIVFTSAAPGGKTTSVANFGVVAAEGGSLSTSRRFGHAPGPPKLFGLRAPEAQHRLLMAPLADLAQSTATRPVGPHRVGRCRPILPTGGLEAHARLSVGGEGFRPRALRQPPVISVTDGIALAAQCDGVVLVIPVGAIAPGDPACRRANRGRETGFWGRPEQRGSSRWLLLQVLSYYRGYQGYYSGDGKVGDPAVVHAVTFDCWGTLCSTARAATGATARRLASKH